MHTVQGYFLLPVKGKIEVHVYNMHRCSSTSQMHERQTLHDEY